MRLNKSQQFYLETHRNDPVDELSEATGLTATRIKNYLKKLPPLIVAEAIDQPKSTDGRTTCMTAASSAESDEFQNKYRKQANEKFLKKRMNNSIHVIDPSKPVH